MGYIEKGHTSLLWTFMLSYSKDTNQIFRFHLPKNSTLITGIIQLKFN